MDPLRRLMSLLLGQLTRSLADSPFNKGQEMIGNKQEGGSIQQLIPNSDPWLLEASFSVCVIGGTLAQDERQ